MSLINHEYSFISLTSTRRSIYVTAETNNSLSHSQTNIQGHCSKAPCLSMRTLWLLDTHQIDVVQFVLKLGPSSLFFLWPPACVSCFLCCNYPVRTDQEYVHMLRCCPNFLHVMLTFGFPFLEVGGQEFQERLVLQGLMLTCQL